ncbi:MAG: Pyridoxine 5'-phosphate synthase [Myxococcota bacterium]|nr:Pyridoxine 5'-phosphate synthase [Myxococcota bacterium]
MIAAKKKLLCVNIDHVATLRQARGGVEPDPVHAAAICEAAGADGITIHLREDRRHIQDRDLRLLKQTVQTTLNLEMAVTGEMTAVALDVKPHKVTLVPERRQELTTEGGLDVAGALGPIRLAVDKLREGGIHVSLFVDPEEHQVRAAKAAGANAIEIHTGPWCHNPGGRELRRIIDSAALAQSVDLVVCAGHGLNYRNIQPLLEIEPIVEFNIGHSIISRAVLTGLEQAVRDMKAVIAAGGGL